MKRTCLLFAVVLITHFACGEDRDDDTAPGTSDGTTMGTDDTNTQTESMNGTEMTPPESDRGDSGDTGQSVDRGDSGTGDPACGDIPWIGCCVGNVIHYCENPASPHLVTQDCGGYSCGYSAKIKLFKCNSNDTPPAGYSLECPEGSY